jgi:hypothetical protein
MRGRSYSYSPSPPRGYSRRRRSTSPRGRYGGRGRDLPTSLLVRNLHLDCRYIILNFLLFAFNCMECVVNRLFGDRICGIKFIWVEIHCFLSCVC